MSSIIKVDTIQTAAGGTPTAADLGLDVSGNALQVVQSITASQISTTSTSYVASGLSANITPASTSSKVLISLTFWPNIGGDDGFVTFYRDSTNVLNGYAFRYSNTAENCLTVQYLDSPSTTSQITYQPYYFAGSGSTFYLNGNNRMATFILTEFA